MKFYQLKYPEKAANNKISWKQHACCTSRKALLRVRWNTILPAVHDEAELVEIPPLC